MPNVIPEYLTAYCVVNLGDYFKNKNNITASVEQTIHKFKIFNTRLIISGYMDVLQEYRLTPHLILA